MSDQATAQSEYPSIEQIRAYCATLRAIVAPHTPQPLIVRNRKEQYQ